MSSILLNWVYVLDYLRQVLRSDNCNRVHVVDYNHILIYIDNTLVYAWG